MKFLLPLLLLATTVFGQQTPSQKNYDPPFNLLLNGNFEKKLSGWTSSGGTFAHVTSGANLLFDKGSSSFDASSTGQYIQTKLYTIPDSLKSASCMGRIYYKGGDANLVLKALDGSSNLLASATLSATTSTVAASVVFSCPSSGSVRLRVESTANAAIIYVDNAHVGIADNLSQVSQASYFGGTKYTAAANCQWSSSTGSYTNFSADSDCATPINYGQAAQVTKIPAVTFPSLPPGEYKVVVSATAMVSSGTTSCNFRINDGTNFSVESESNYLSAYTTHQMTGQFSYSTAQSNITFQVQAYTVGGVGNCDIYTDTGSGVNREFRIDVYRFPTSQETVYRPDTVAWKVDANLGGANAALGGTTSSYSEITNSGLDIVQNPGSISVQVPCSGTNPSTGLTCSAGDESLGVVFTAPRAGAVEVCADFTPYSTSGTSQSNDASFQLVETPNNAQTILKEGNTRGYFIVAHGPASNNVTVGSSQHVCGIFNFDSAGQKTIRLMYESSAMATGISIQMDRGSTLGQPDIHFTARPIDQQIPAPLLVNSVVSDSAGVEKIARLAFGDAGSLLSPVSCSSSPCSIYTQSGSWISGVVRNGTGDYTATISAGTFSSAPICTANRISSATLVNCEVAPSSATTLEILCRLNNAPTDASVSILCMGPK